ncbi:dynactin subunit 4-like [Gigantopelta aegis]|uniref:dynactin subunit 4-like n=1 Tax=Gigantopelta aegis TaxID=1735272 RepID=UPI001B88D8AA|nr:dynactin subunit 4-like [Gigantopelta aegis]
MSTYIDINLVKYVCSCGKKQPFCRLYLCRHCSELRCVDCVQHEGDSHYCSHCLENMPSAEAKMRKNRCSRCLDCPACGNTLMTRATNLMVTTPDANKASTPTTPKKMYYLACGFCRWTTRDVAIPDQTVASGGLPEQENEANKLIAPLLEHYHLLAQKEKTEKERKKYVKRRSHMYYAAEKDKYGLISVAMKKTSLASALTTHSLKEDEVKMVEPVAGTVTDFDALPASVYTEPLDVLTVTTMSQRLANCEFQPVSMLGLYPLRKHLLLRKSLRCKECEHNLIKPDYNPLSIKFKIQLNAINFVPDIRIQSPAVFMKNKETLVCLTVSNPSVYNMAVHLLPVEGAVDPLVTAKIDLPRQEIVIWKRDDAAIYDDTSQLQHEIRDDPSLVAFRKANKIGLYVRVTPFVDTGDVTVNFHVKHEYRNTTATIQSEVKEPPVVWLDHQVFVTVGKIQQ